MYTSYADIFISKQKNLKMNGLCLSVKISLKMGKLWNECLFDRRKSFTKIYFKT